MERNLHLILSPASIFKEKGDSAWSIGNTPAALSISFAALIRGFHPQRRMDHLRGPAQGSFLPFPPSLLFAVKSAVNKIAPQSEGTARSLAVCHQLKALIFSMELNDRGEAGLGVATSGSLQRALREGRAASLGSCAPAR